MLSRINLILLRELLGEKLHLIGPPTVSSPRRGAWRGHLDGIDDAFLSELLAGIEQREVSTLFVDGSNFGAAVATVKRRAPRVKIITFFHNVEARFFFGSLRVRRSPKALAVLAANYVAERAAVRWSDVLVTLSERDSMGLHRIYGRGADAIAPMVVKDNSETGLRLPISTGERYHLFVGGSFYANISGIKWLVRTIAPRIDLPVHIVGRGLDTLAGELAVANNAVLIGAVEDLAPVYAGATSVLAPIFDGSGMKTKVAEALMFGKQVVGTPEAFSGYAADVVAKNWCCTDADSFVAAIRTIEANPPPAWDPTMRALYDRDHSMNAARSRLEAILAADFPLAKRAAQLRQGRNW